MALTEEELQEKRDTAADLQRQIAEEKQNRASLVVDKERQTTADVLDTEIERLQQELDAEKALTAQQEAAITGVTSPQDFNAGAGVAADPNAEHLEPGDPDAAPLVTVEAGAPGTPQVPPVPVTPTPPAADKADKGTTSKENS